MKKGLIFSLSVFFLISLNILFLPCESKAGNIERVSVDNSGGEGNSDSYIPSISSDGRYVAFHSEADNLVVDDTNDRSDVFVYDRDTDTIERVSLNNSGVQGNNNSYDPSISSDGRYVAFRSNATNLVTGDTNVRVDVFVYDRDTDTIERVSLNNSGVQGDGNCYYPSISSDGHYVAFASYATNLVTGDNNSSSDVFVYDRDTDTIERVSLDNTGGEGNSHSYLPSISSDGRYVAFLSDSTDLVTGDTNTQTDVFVYDRNTNTIERVSVDNSGGEGNNLSNYPSINSDGRYVAFSSAATNLVTGDTNGYSDVFVSYTVDDPSSPPGGGGGGSGGCFISTTVSGSLIKPHVMLLMLFFGIGIIGFAGYRRKIRK